jgi:Protein of unknown function (DUF3891)
MLRLESETGWWLVSHPDHARLAAAFAEHWGNERFLPPEPRAKVLLGIAAHDDGWAARDAAPHITRQGKPSAFSAELVGRYSAFEEIDLADYLAVREEALRAIAERDAYAALLVSMHTYNLLTERADRSTISKEQLPLLDEFLVSQKSLQENLYARVKATPGLAEQETAWPRILDHWRLLQATDNLSLLSCVSFAKPANLLHALPMRDGESAPIQVEAIAERHFRLSPYPFDKGTLTFEFPARHVEGKLFDSAAELQLKYAASVPENLLVTVSA